MRKPLVKGYESALNLELYRKLETQMLNACEDSGIQHFHFDETQQRGNNFGDRFCNAIEDVFSYGFSNVVIIGNDSPDVTARSIIQSACHVEEGKSSIIPSQHGGFSCLGISHKSFNRAAFLKVNWRTDTVCKEMIDILGSDCKVLDKAIELEGYEDLFEFVENTDTYSAFYAFVLTLVNPFVNILRENTPKSQQDFNNHFGRRGPPFKA